MIERESKTFEIELTNRIPKGIYCYDENGSCPHHSRRKDLPLQENGFCSFLNKSDYDINEEKGEMSFSSKNGNTRKVSAHDIYFSLIWDEVKECEINNEL